MIIGRALGAVLEGETFTINSKEETLKFNYGNQDALDKFIAQSNKAGAKKYPLAFYVVNPVKEFNGWKYCDSDLIIMMNTKEEFLYKERTDKVYTAYIEPIYQRIKSVLTTHPFIQILDSNENKFSYTDFPNYGIVKGDVGSGKSKKSVVTDYVDARIIKIKLRIKTNCI